jgi:hypothetical protein
MSVPTLQRNQFHENLCPTHSKFLSTALNPTTTTYLLLAHSFTIN